MIRDPTLVFRRLRNVPSEEVEGTDWISECKACEGTGIMHTWVAKIGYGPELLPDPDGRQCPVCKGMGRHRYAMHEL